MKYDDFFFIFKRATLLILMLLIFTPAFSQKKKGNPGTLKKKGAPGTLQIVQRDGRIQVVSLATGVTIRRIACDSLLLNTVWYKSVSAIIPNECDTVITSVAELSTPLHSEQLELAVYPNPSRGQVRIQLCSSSNEVVTIQVFNIMGVMIHQFEPLALHNSSLEINWNFNSTTVTSVPSGMYFIRATTPRGIVTRSIEFFR